MIFILYIFSWFSLLLNSETGRPQVADVRSYYLSDIFSDTIIFNDLCDLRASASASFQNMSSGLGRYFNYERIYSKAGNDLNVMFHFSDESLCLYSTVWEKYLIYDKLVAGETMFFTINVNYNGEDYTNGKLFRRVPFEYNIYSDVEMSRIDYKVITTDSCGNNHELLEVEANFNGMISNAAGTRNIYLDNVRLIFQVDPVDTAAFVIPPGAKTYIPEPRNDDPVQDFVQLSEGFEGVFVEKWHELDCAKWKGKPFMCFDKSRMLFRLPEPHFTEIISLENNRYFNPLGTEKPMKEWVLVRAAYKKDWNRLAKIAAEYVRQ